MRGSKGNGEKDGICVRDNKDGILAFPGEKPFKNHLNKELSLISSIRKDW